MLENTVYKLNNDKKLKIAYFGGSITEGVGASDRSRTSWAGRTTEWFRQTFPDAEIIEKNAAIGGTGSDFGVARTDKQIIASFDPDLLFLEFAVNDSIWGYHDLQANVEGIFRKLRRHNPYIDIVLVFTCTVSDDEDLSSGKHFRSRTAHASVAYHYGDIPIVEIGETLRAETIKAGGDWMKYTVDQIHPSDEGYAILARTMTEHLTKYLVNAPIPNELKKNALPELLSRSDRSGAYSFGIEDIYHSEDFQRVDKNIGRYDHYYKASHPGTELKFKYRGRKIGLELYMTDSSGEIEYQIDDGEVKTVKCWDEACPFYERLSPIMLNCIEMENGEHTLSVRLTDNKIGKSKGYDFCVAQFFVL